MIRWVLVLLWVATGALAQVTVEPERSVVRDGWWTLQIDLRLSEVTPYRVFTLDDPKRLVLDFHDLDWTGVDPNALLDGNRATAIRIDDIQDQWSRMVIDLAEPLEVVEAGMRANQSGADLKVVMERTSKAAFAAASRTPSDLGWNLQDVSQRDTATTSTGRDDFVVVLDPGHGGIDPGAERAGLNEAELMLTFAQETATALAKVPDLSVVLTRDEDVF
ncbi:MAG: N-acetylmuramoyl-L-alanine amidase, partial [Pseudomonadota bacterium]